MSDKNKNTGGQGQDLKRVLSLPMCVSLAVGAIIGAGIFTMTGTGIGIVGKAVPMVFVLAILFVSITNLPIIYQSGALPATGGSYMYLSRFIHPIAGYTHIISSTIGMLNIAVMGISFATYFSSLFPALEQNGVILVASIAIILILGIASLFGAKISGYVQYIVVILMLVSLLVYIIPGMIAVSPEYITFQEAFFPATVKLGTIWAALGILRYSLQGGGIVFTLGDEVKNPRVTIPASFFIATIVVGILYAIIGYITVGVLPVEEVAGQPLTVAAAQILGTGFWFQFFVIGGALLAIVTTLNGSFMIYSRTHFAAARDKIWPSIVAKTNKHNVPNVAIWICMAVGIIAVLFFRNSLSDLLMFVSVPGLVLAFLYYIPPILIKYKLPNCAKNAWFKLPQWLNIILCVGSSILTFVLGMSVFGRLQPKHWIGMAAIYIIGFVYYFLRYKWLKKNEGIDLFAQMRGMHPYWIETENKLSGTGEESKADETV